MESAYRRQFHDDDEIIRPEPSPAPSIDAGVPPSEFARRRLTSRGTPAVRQAVAQQRLKKTIEKASARTPSERDIQVTITKRLADFSNPSSPCCSLNCRATLPIESVRAELTRFLHLPEAQKTQYIANCITSAPGSSQLLQCVNGIRVCVALFRAIFKISNYRLYDVKNARKDGRSVERSRSSRNRQPEKSAIVSNWLQDLTQVSEHMPHKDSVHIPYATKTDAYAAFNEDCIAKELPAVSESFFNEVWRANFPHIKCRRPHDFAVCKLCVDLQDQMLVSTVEARREELRRIQAAHLASVSRDRTLYEQHKDKAKRHPDKFLSIIIDGADQSNYSLPHFYTRSKENDKGRPYAAKLQGAIAHGVATFAFMVPMNAPAGSNLTIETLHRILLSLFRDGSRPIPPKLYLQLDNTSGQNKNSYVLAYLQFLAQTLFQEVELNFLPVGHTHADVDQMFKVFKGAMDRSNALSRQEFLYRLQQVYTPSPSIALLDVQANWSEFLDGSGTLFNKLPRVTDFQSFKFERTVQGVQMAVRRSMGEETWAPSRPQSNQPNAGVLSRVLGLDEIEAGIPASASRPLEPDVLEQVIKHVNACHSRISNISPSALLSLLDDIQALESPSSHTFHWEMQFYGSRQQTLPPKPCLNLAVLDMPTRIESSTVVFSKHSFLAVRPDPDEEALFWIAKVLQDVMWKDRQLNIPVIWYQSTSRDHSVNGRFLPCDNDGELFEDTVLLETIIHCFPRLTEGNTGKVPSDVMKTIRDRLDKFSF